MATITHLSPIVYQVYDVRTNEVIGTITGAELRKFMNCSAQSTVFNGKLVEQFNNNKRRIDEPERIRQMLRK
jgi:hypothetical protein